MAVYAEIPIFSGVLPEGTAIAAWASLSIQASGAITLFIFGILRYKKVVDTSIDSLSILEA